MTESHKRNRYHMTVLEGKRKRVASKAFIHGNESKVTYPLDDRLCKYRCESAGQKKSPMTKKTTLARNFRSNHCIQFGDFLKLIIIITDAECVCMLMGALLNSFI